MKSNGLLKWLMLPLLLLLLYVGVKWPGSSREDAGDGTRARNRL